MDEECCDELKKQMMLRLKMLLSDTENDKKDEE